jgi:small subunit ribosomal protein S1
LLFFYHLLIHSPVGSLGTNSATSHLTDFFSRKTMTDTQTSEFQQLIEDGAYLQLPAVGDVVKGKVISSCKREVRIDIEGITTGVVRGRELFNECSDFAKLKAGEEVEGTLIELENENGEMELSFRFAGQKKAWEEIRTLFTGAEATEVKVLEANKGGLIVRLKHVTGFLPVSQLSPEHYPRVSGGDKHKILEKLKGYVGQKFTVRVIDADENDEKLIVSEKNIWEELQKNVIAKYNIGDVVEGTVTAVADFGAFVKFDSLEGLVHISEIAWQRIDHPRDILKLHETVKAEIIGLEGSKIFLSMKKLIKDPWAAVAERYNVGDMVEGTILKVNPFGFFVELDDEIHGLAHVSELSNKPVTDVNELGTEGEKKMFRIVSIEPKEHRLGLSLKTDEKKEEKKEEAKPESETKEEVKEETPAEETKKETTPEPEAKETKEEAPVEEVAVETKEEETKE